MTRQDGTEYGETILITEGRNHDNAPYLALREAIARSHEAQMVSALNWDQPKPPLPILKRARHWLGDRIVSLAEWVSGKVYGDTW